MTISEIKRLIADNGLYPILVTSNSDEDSTDVPRFDGTLDEFWPAAKALGAAVVFLHVVRLEEADFGQPAPDDVPYDEEDEEEMETSEEGSPIIDLEEELPSISKFRKYLGEECAFVLSTKGGAAPIEMLIQNDWWKKFLEEADKAVELWTDKQSERQEKAEAENEEREKELIEALKGLIDDRAFCVLPTQRAMKTYALEKHPELDDLSEDVLKIEIQGLHDKIQTKGLNRKR